MNSKPIILIAAAALISATACDRDIESTVQPQHVTFTLSFDGAAASATRATYDGLTGVWEVGDEVYVYLTSTDNVSYGPYTFTPDAAGERATFQAEITGIPDGTRIASIDAYHYDNLDAVAFDNGTISYSLPAAADGTLSYMTVSSYDYPSGSEPAASEGGTIDITEALTFTHCLSRIDIETDIPNIRDVTIGMVGGSFPSSGRLDVADGVTTAAATTALLHATPSDNFQIGIIPVDFGGDRKLRAVVVTTDGEAYTREVTVSAFEKAKRYTLDLSTGPGINSVTPVSTEEALIKMSNSDGGDFVLTADITLQEIPNIPGFKGSLDGNGYKISLPETSSVDASEAGIFGSIANDVTITNLNVDAKTLTMNTRNGGIIAGSVTSGTITLNNVHVTGTVTASQSGEGDDNHIFAGGLVGFVKNGAYIAATNCSFSGTITANQPQSIAEYQYNSYVGGIVGSVESGIEEFKNDEYHGSEAGNPEAGNPEAGKGSTITNCFVMNSTISNLLGGKTDWPYLLERATEFYTGGIAGRCTGLIIECSVTNTKISGVRSDNGYRKMIKPILGNDYYEHINNDNNSYTNVTINGGEARTGIYKGSKAAGTDTPSYEELQ